MFQWLKKMVSGERQADIDSSQAEPEIEPKSGRGSSRDDPTTGTIRIQSAWEVVDQFLQQNPAPTPFGVHALVRAGATNLIESQELLRACDKIEEHGYQNPINPTLRAELKKSELLDYLRWHEESGIEKEYYANEIMVRDLIQQFRSR